MKIEYPPLLNQGFQTVKLDQLKPMFLAPFPASTTRVIILRRFKNWLKGVKKLNVSCEIWIDGSFATEKVDPRDIDVVLFISSTDQFKLEKSPKKQLLERLTNQGLTKEQRKKCLCDSYLGFLEDELDHREWERIYGRLRDGVTLKGIFRIVI